jgi:hypothetical protein
LALGQVTHFVEKIRIILQRRAAANSRLNAAGPSGHGIQGMIDYNVVAERLLRVLAARIDCIGRPIVRPRGHIRDLLQNTV